MPDHNDGASSRRGRDSRISAAEASELALGQIADLVGKPVEGVIGVEPGEGGWLISVEVVEARRVPSSTDILSIYEAEIGAGGDLLAYRRMRRYPRGQGDGTEET